MAEPEHIKETIESASERLKESQSETNDNGNNNSSYYCEKCGKDTHPTEDHGKLGGARKGAGFPQGALKKKTLEAMKVKDAVTQRILGSIDKLYNAQMNLAIGEQVLMRKVTERGPKGGVARVYHEQVTDLDTIIAYLDQNEGMPGTIDGNDDEWYYLSIRPANNQALDSLMNRALGKVPEKLEVSGGFFSQNELVIRVIGSKHADIDIGPDGQIVEPGDGTTDSGPEREAEPSPETT